ncbi:hypothetical protein EU538_09620 [Candidatus Thorarchaeota archaeon]|nr:MAG: hypothetical protein EU538_09620 [Candidatus Thorarchaeota archaeon]
MEQAASEFDDAQRTMDDFTDIFPMSWERDFEDGDRERGAQLLTDAQIHFKNGLKHMHNALNPWKQ